MLSNVNRTNKVEHKLLDSFLDNDIKYDVRCEMDVPRFRDFNADPEHKE